tara:strand:- start:280 stop:507 length:228 start_codon:yes stop_codon:yes gene_type:complete
MNAKPNLRLCDENDAMQVEPSFEYVLTQIDSLKTEFADIEADLYEQLAIEGQLMLIGTAMDPFHWRRNGPTPFVP